MENIEWILTDCDTNQYGRKISENVFEFEEDRDGELFQMEIDLNDYTDSDIEDVISSYGYSLSTIEKLYGSDSKFIIAECLFEMEQ